MKPLHTEAKTLTAPSVGSGDSFGVWQPIENAPRDGTNILATDGELIALVWWFDEWRDHGDIGAAGQYDFKPTHWMHLPLLPNVAGQTAAPNTQP